MIRRKKIVENLQLFKEKNEIIPYSDSDAMEFMQALHMLEITAKPHRNIKKTVSNLLTFPQNLFPRSLHTV